MECNETLVFEINGIFFVKKMTRLENNFNGAPSQKRKQMPGMASNGNVCLVVK